MSQHLNEKEAREKAKDLRKFYSHLTIYGLINFAGILIWLVSGGGYFWPIWVLIGWGIGLALEAASLGLAPLLIDVFPFLSPEWEEKEARRLMTSAKESPPKENLPKAIPQKVAPAPVAVALKPGAVKKPAPKKTAAKKPKK